MRMRTMIVASILALGGLALAIPLAHAGCGGGGTRSFGRGYGGSACGGRCGMNMGGMAMPGMNMTGVTMPSTGMSPMNMNTNAGVAPAQAAAGSYYCPMHPNVRSAVPATCPYCQMALKAL